MIVACDNERQVYTSGGFVVYFGNDSVIKYSEACCSSANVHHGTIADAVY